MSSSPQKQVQCVVFLPTASGLHQFLGTVARALPAVKAQHRSKFGWDLPCQAFSLSLTEHLGHPEIAELGFSNLGNQNTPVVLLSASSYPMDHLRVGDRIFGTSKDTSAEPGICIGGGGQLPAPTISANRATMGNIVKVHDTDAFTRFQHVNCYRGCGHESALFFGGETEVGCWYRRTATEVLEMERQEFDPRVNEFRQSAPSAGCRLEIHLGSRGLLTSIWSFTPLKPLPDALLNMYDA